MKGLVIAPQPFFTYRGTPFSVYYRAMVMAELENELDLLTYGEGYDIDIPNVRVIRVPRIRCLGETKVGPSWPKFLYDIFLFFRMLGLLLRNRYDYVHAHEEAAIIAAIMKPVFRYPLIYDMHSSLPEQLTNFSFSKSRLLKRIMYVLERFTLNTADVVVTVCPSLFNYANNIMSSEEESVLIENSLNSPLELKSMDKTPGPPSRAEIDDLRLPEGKRLIVYAGTLEVYQGIELLLEGFGLVCHEDDTADLLVIGGNEEQVAHYRSIAQGLGILDRCKFTGYVRQDLATRCIEMATVVVSPRTRGTNTPLKIYQQLASGVPIVATNIESHTQVLTDDIAYLVDPNPTDFAAAILSVLNDPSKATLIAENAMRHHSENYSRPIYVEKIKRVLDMVERLSQKKKR